jgi:hypothetical protein
LISGGNAPKSNIGFPRSGYVVATAQRLSSPTELNVNNIEQLPPPAGTGCGLAGRFLHALVPGTLARTAGENVRHRRASGAIAASNEPELLFGASANTTPICLLTLHKRQIWPDEHPKTVPDRPVSENKNLATKNSDSRRVWGRPDRPAAKF